MDKPMKKCRHCGQVRHMRPRQLCWTCFYLPGVRERYPSLSKFAPKGNGWKGEPWTPHRQPATATNCLPGTDAKIEVMAERAARGESVFHPADAGMDLGMMPARLAG